jgi:hypothetical protein
MLAPRYSAGVVIPLSVNRSDARVAVTIPTRSRSTAPERVDHLSQPSGRGDRQPEIALKRPRSAPRHQGSSGEPPLRQRRRLLHKQPQRPEHTPSGVSPAVGPAGGRSSGVPVGPPPADHPIPRSTTGMPSNEHTNHQGGSPKPHPERDMHREHPRRSRRGQDEPDNEHDRAEHGSEWAIRLSLRDKTRSTPAIRPAGRQGLGDPRDRDRIVTPGGRTAELRADASALGLTGAPTPCALH